MRDALRSICSLLVNKATLQGCFANPLCYLDSCLHGLVGAIGVNKAMTQLRAVW